MDQQNVHNGNQVNSFTLLTADCRTRRTSDTPLKTCKKTDNCSMNAQCTVWWNGVRVLTVKALTFTFVFKITKSSIYHSDQRYDEGENRSLQSTMRHTLTQDQPVLKYSWVDKLSPCATFISAFIFPLDPVCIFCTVICFGLNIPAWIVLYQLRGSVERGRKSASRVRGGERGDGQAEQRAVGRVQGLDLAR